MKRALRYVFGLLLVAALVVAFLLITFLRPLPVSVARVERDVAVEVFGLGTVEARVVSKLGFEVGAALIALYSDQGDRVTEGTVLARLHSAEQEARVARAKAGIVNAEAAIKKAQASVGRARAVHPQREQTNRRQKALLARGSVSFEVADEAQMEEAVARAELAVALSDVDVASAALKDAEAEFDLEKALLDHHILRAPYDGLVIARHRELGTVLNAGESVFAFVDPSTVWALAYVDEARAGHIRLGQPATVKLRSLPQQRFRGHVTRVDIESDRVSEERRVYITCDECPERFHLGEQAEIFITTGVFEQALLVPEAAVEGFDGERGVVWTVEDARLQRRGVTFGQTTLDARLEILEGLPPGAHVVTAHRPGLREGRAASIVEDPSS